jgi:hypothetical protein
MLRVEVLPNFSPPMLVKEVLSTVKPLMVSRSGPKENVFKNGSPTKPRLSMSFTFGISMLRSKGKNLMFNDATASKLGRSIVAKCFKPLTYKDRIDFKTGNSNVVIFSFGESSSKFSWTLISPSYTETRVLNSNGGLMTNVPAMCTRPSNMIGKD